MLSLALGYVLSALALALGAGTRALLKPQTSVALRKWANEETSYIGPVPGRSANEQTKAANPDISALKGKREDAFGGRWQEKVDSAYARPSEASVAVLGLTLACVPLVSARIVPSEWIAVVFFAALALGGFVAWLYLQDHLNWLPRIDKLVGPITFSLILLYALLALIMFAALVVTTIAGVPSTPMPTP